MGPFSLRLCVLQAVKVTFPVEIHYRHTLRLKYGFMDQFCSDLSRLVTCGQKIIGPHDPPKLPLSKVLNPQLLQWSCSAANRSDSQQIVELGSFQV